MPNTGGRLTGVPVLVVEEESFCASYVGRGLEDAGATLLGPFASCADALHSVEQASPGPAVAVLGLGGAGIEPLAGALDARHIPYLLMNRPQGAEIEPCVEGHLCFCKPFGAYQIVEAIENLAR